MFRFALTHKNGTYGEFLLFKANMIKRNKGKKVSKDKNSV